MIAVGIDASLRKTAVMVLPEDGTHISALVLNDESDSLLGPRFVRFNKIVREIVRIIEPVDPGVICIEGYAFSRNMAGHSYILECGAILRLRLLALGFEIYEVPPTSLKKWATGKGNGDKTPVIASLTKRYGVVFETDDQYDAYALARIGLQIKGAEQPANQTQAECIETIVNGKPKKTRKTKAKS